MQNLKFILGSLCLGLFVFFSCNDPSLIGSDLLDDDLLDLQFSDSFEITARTVKGDSLLTFEGTERLDIFHIGEIDEPIFGKYSSTIYTEFERAVTTSPQFAGATLDSAILILPFDIESNYGDVVGENFEMDILKINNNIAIEGPYDTDDSFSADFLETVNFTVSTDSVDVYNTITDTLERLPPHFRIPLEESLAMELFNADDTIYTENDLLQDFFPGLALQPNSNSEGMVGLRLIAINSVVNPSLRFYYRDVDNDTLIYTLPVASNSVKTVNYQHDFSGSLVEDFIEQGKAGGDSLLFVQAMEGTDVELEFNNLADFQGIVVNKAELVIHLDSLPNDDLEKYPPAEQLTLNEILEDGTRQSVEDLSILFATRTLEDIFILFGGSLDESTNTYRINFSTHFQKMIDGEATNKLEIAPFLRINQATRAIFKGPGRAQDALRLEVFYTRI